MIGAVGAAALLSTFCPPIGPLAAVGLPVLLLRHRRRLPKRRRKAILIAWSLALLPEIYMLVFYEHVLSWALD